MSLPFTPAQFFEVMAAYNEGVWPAQVALNAAALAALALVPLGGRLPGRLVSAVLAALWAWAGIAYHFAYFTGINPLAAAFGALFLGGAALFAWHGMLRGRLQFEFRARAPGAVLGVVMLAYALLGYPLLAVLLGHEYPRMPTFGLPCPVTLYTAGMLLFLKPAYPRSVLVAPLAWALIGASAAFLFGVYEDTALLAAAAIAAALVLRAPPALEPA